MCGRYQFTGEDRDERVAAILAMLEKSSPGQYSLGEIVPGTAAPGVVARGNRLLPVPAVFGFTGREDRLLYNARSETAAEKPSFREALRSARIVLPADCFFERDRETGESWRFRAPGLSTLYLGGLYRLEGSELRFVILTRAANGDVAPVHHRMPFILGPEAVRPWLTREAAALELLRGDPPRLARERCREAVGPGFPC